jgi:hypothetical protein
MKLNWSSKGPQYGWREKANSLSCVIIHLSPSPLGSLSFKGLLTYRVCYYHVCREKQRETKREGDREGGENGFAIANTCKTMSWHGILLRQQTVSQQLWNDMIQHFKCVSLGF